MQSLSSDQDKIIWADSSYGIYTVASSYSSQIPQTQDAKLLWAKAWIPSLTPKINVFFWLLLQNRILTINNLIKR